MQQRWSCVREACSSVGGHWGCVGAACRDEGLRGGGVGAAWGLRAAVWGECGGGEWSAPEAMVEG